MHRRLMAFGPMIILIWLASSAFGATGQEAMDVRLDRVTFNSGDPVRANLFVTVQDGSGQAVLDLTRENFRLEEDGFPCSSPIQVAPFVVTERDLSFALLIDNNENLATSLTLVRRGANEFVCEMGFRYTGVLLTYGDTPQMVVKPTKDAYRLTLAIDSLSPVRGRPRLGEALLMGIDSLQEPGKESETGPDRRVLILLTEGRDEASLFSLEAAGAKLVESGVGLFVIGYGLQDTPTMKLLSGLASRTGGETYFAAEPDDLETVLLAVADRLRHQYVITYIPKRIGLDGKNHKVTVMVEQEENHGRAQLEFVSPGQGPGLTVLPFLLVAGLLAVSLVGAALILRQSLVNKNRQKKYHWLDASRGISN